MEDGESLLVQLGKAIPLDGVKDTLRSTVTQEGCFLVKSWYMALELRITESFLWQVAGRFFVQPKVCLFTWEAVWTRFLLFD